MTENDQPNTAPADTGAPYQVLARKYRPVTFAGLIGQDAMVRTLTNAIKADRLAHAFILTGVRGIGKTTTARIIARALNCVGPEGTGGPTAEPCGTCVHCVAITEDRHVDVLEMDAASRTGVDDIRELIEGVRYRPTSARFKVYIIDEVHMLSKNAFNALLKTLEEPPEHVKFVFATTETRKVPVTVLSRCQRFDLRRVDAETLAAHYKDVAEREGANVSDAALGLIARAADGSVRDGLSLLDQAISHTGHASGEAIGEDDIRDMLGLADRSRSFMLLEAIMAGDVAPALKLLEEMYREGADPRAVFEDLLEITHWLTRIKVVPDAAADPHVPEIERIRGRDLEGRLSMAALARAWQMLLKGLSEVHHAPSPIQAAEMVVVRLAYAAGLPTPEEAIRALTGGEGAATGPRDAPATEAAKAAPAPRSGGSTDSGTKARMTGTGETVAAPETRAEPVAEARPGADVQAKLKARPDPATFEDVADLAARHGQARLHRFLTGDVRLVRFEPGRIAFNTESGAPGEMVQALREFLDRATGRTWTLTVTSEEGGPTLEDQGDRGAAEAKALTEHPLVRAVLDTFPGAVIDEVRPAEATTANDAPDAVPDDDPSRDDAPTG